MHFHYRNHFEWFLLEVAVIKSLDISSFPVSSAIGSVDEGVIAPTASSQILKESNHIHITHIRSLLLHVSECFLFSVLLYYIAFRTDLSPSKSTVPSLFRSSSFRISSSSPFLSFSANRFFKASFISSIEIFPSPSVSNWAQRPNTHSSLTAQT